MKIGEFSEATGWSVDTIRFYESKGLLCPERDESSRYRRFSPSDLEIAEAIDIGRALGFSLAEIRNGVQAWREGALTRERKEAILRDKLTQLDEKLEELQSIRSYLERKLAWVEQGEEGEFPSMVGRHRR